MFPISSSLGVQPLQYALTEFKDKFLQILGSVNVYQESVIVVFYFRLVETVFYQSCLSQPPGGNESYVVSIGDLLRQKTRFFYPVTEIFL